MAASVSRRRQPHPDRGGYDCEFVTPPPDAFQVECPICLQVLKEPCLISCQCGQKICRECVEQIKKDNKPCPLCNLTDFTYIRDHGLERYLKEQEVWCSKKKDGCDWKRKLGEYEHHLNQNPSPENQLTGCQFVEVECKHMCGEWFQRRHIAAHQKSLCPKRPYCCEYCNEYKSTFEDVTKNHHHQCNKFPVTCPNKCREAPFEQQKVKNHVKVECPLTEVNCPLHYAGCEVRLPRKDMPEHMRDTVTHLTLLATVTQTLLKENQELKQHNQQLEAKQIAIETHYQELRKATEKNIETQVYENQKLRQNIEDLKKENHKIQLHNQKQRMLKQLATERTIERHGKGLKATEIEVEALKKQVHELKLTSGRFPIDFHVNYILMEEQYMPSFHTHSHGYQICIKVHPHGFRDGKGTHLSIFTQLMKGQFDDHLKWPFRGKITIQIVNQAGDHSHVEKTIPYNDKTPDRSAGRVIDKERSGGWGFREFLAHTDLYYSATKNTQYLKDNIIIVRVVRVKITQ